MLKGRDIICISSIDWDFIWQGHQEIMATFARNANRILFIENTGARAPGIRDLPRIKKRILNWMKGIRGIRQHSENLYIYSPIVLPFPYSRIARWLNKWIIVSTIRQWMKALNFLDPIVWVFLPTGITLDILSCIDTKLILYYCIDNFVESSTQARKVKRAEETLLGKADLVFVTSKALMERCSLYNKSVHIFPFGVNIEPFRDARIHRAAVPMDMRNIPHPVIGYIGGVHKWIDFDLMKDVASRTPEYSYVFVGPIQTDISLLSGMSNVYFLGNKPHPELPAYINAFEVCTIPYLITEYTRNVYPTKLNEYLSLGRPVVSTPLPEIKYFNQMFDNIVYVGEGSAGFEAGLKKALAPCKEDVLSKRIKAGEMNSWQNRIEQMSEIISSALIKKSLERESRWEETFSGLYRNVRRRFVKIAAIASLSYLVVFYTPALWLLARPLKIVELPRKADVIVVFAGGVGESGKAGEGYEERVKQAVDLYNGGYADYIIFSSGYMYIFKEPVVMKALAVSLGVPEERIILEDAAANTYENVKFVKEILDRHSWKEALLVTSPYNTVRASLVFKKIAGDINVTYTPVLSTKFYGNEKNRPFIGRQIGIQQIKGILHEYLGIIYYLWKGYI